jgi:hypothetical protein
METQLDQISIVIHNMMTKSIITTWVLELKNPSQGRPIKLMNH